MLFSLISFSRAFRFLCISNTDMLGHAPESVARYILVFIQTDYLFKRESIRLRIFTPTRVYSCLPMTEFDCVSDRTKSILDVMGKEAEKES